VRAKKRTRRPRSIATVLIVLLGTLPVISAIHLARVPHVYSSEHRHFHEVVIQGRPVADSNDKTDIQSRDGAAQFKATSAGLKVYLVDCPLANVTLRNDLLKSAQALPTQSASLFSLPIQRAVVRVLSEQVLSVAPKHSPPALSS
jgi:hypothetical protein